MAGKSTFLRTIGVNLILARIGAPVCAKEFNFYPFKLFSSLRTVDSLKDNESFFYAELKRLKQLIELYEQKEEFFFLLDEILKGTNSADQHKGSVGLIHNLMALNGNGIIATHDIELANLANEHPEVIRNICFEIEIINNQLKFDYKVKPGFLQNHECLIFNGKYGDYKTTNRPNSKNDLSLIFCKNNNTFMICRTAENVNPTVNPTQIPEYPTAVKAR